MNKTTILSVLLIISAMSFAQNNDYVSSLKAKAEQGDAEAQFELCNYYAKRNIDASDIDNAVDYLLQAAENDYPEALYELGCCYKDGALGLPVWPEKAKLYLFRASELGYGHAKAALEVMTNDYKIFRRGIRKSVFNQIISVAPQSKSEYYNNYKSRFIQQ